MGKEVRVGVVCVAQYRMCLCGVREGGREGV